MKNFSSKNKKGQVVLFVVIIITISLIIATSIASRSLSGQKNVNLNTDASRAFSAAESGIDELLSNSDLAAIAGAGDQEISSVDKSLFSESKYKVEEVAPGYFGKVAKNSLIEVDFSGPPNDPVIYFDEGACVLVSLYNTNAAVSRNIFCSDSVADKINTCSDSIECPISPGGCPPSVLANFGTASCVEARIGNFPAGTPKMMLVKVLIADSNLEISADNDVFITKNVVGMSWATTKTGVKKEIQVTTKTTRDIYPVFDYALYVR